MEAWQVILVIAAVIIGFLIIEYNVCVKLKNKVKQSYSSIDVYLTQRFDLIPNLVECVKSYQVYEEKVLNSLVENRTQYMKNHNVKDATKLNSEMLNIFGVAEGYPNLKASEQFLNLQNALIKMESQLQAARRIYNGDVTLYNTKISTFPTNIVAGFFGFSQADLLEIEEYKKENIKVNF
jgi:LemA protein